MAIDQLVHTRQIKVDAFDIGESRLLLRGSLQDDRFRPVRLIGGDIRPPGIVHGMRLDVIVSCPDFTIVSVEASMPNAPQESCREVLPTLQRLVGLQITPGFTNRVKRLLGGPQSCTHLVSLILAMSAVTLQAYNATIGSREEPGTGQELMSRFKYVVNTCKVWAEDGPLVRRLRAYLDKA